MSAGYQILKDRGEDDSSASDRAHKQSSEKCKEEVAVAQAAMVYR